MSDAARNLPASIHQRLLNRAHETGRAFNELLQYYTIERFLYRLSISNYAEQFILKGALMLNAWGLNDMRPTRDIDLLGHTQNTIDHIVGVFQEVCRQETEPDGLMFDAKRVKGERIDDEAKYEGVRITMTAELGRTRIPIQIDIGFEDVITPGSTSFNYPTILDFPAPHLHGYPPETIIAEKFQAMTALGMANSRMKDFYDIWMLATNFEFDGKTLQCALENTFKNRNTELPGEEHIIFLNEFAEIKAEQWVAFTRKIKTQQTVDMRQIVRLLKDFLLPVVHSSRKGISYKKKWRGKWI